MAFITQILLPKADNLGRPFGLEAYGDFETRMLRRYGGWTCIGVAEGAWLSPSGQLYTEDHWVYEVGHKRQDLRFWRDEKGRLKAEFD
jgi:hypothetical protein